MDKNMSIKLDWLGAEQRTVLERGYLDEGETALERYTAICGAVEHYTNKMGYTGRVVGIEDRFKRYISNNWVSFATPVLKNFGKSDNLSISCNKAILDDSLDSIYSGLHEIGMLAKHGAGTAVDFSKIRGVGSEISTGGKSNSVMDWIELYADMMSKTAQNCYKDDVEVLTNQGFKLFSELDRTELIATVDETGKTTLTKPLDYLVSDFDGLLVRFKNTDDIDISVTPNHNMVINNELVPAKDFVFKEGDTMKSFYNHTGIDYEFSTENIVTTQERYVGKVYCVTVETGRILVRSNGRTLVCGNSARRGFLTAYLSADHPEIMEFLNIGTKAIPKDKERFFQTITTGVTLPIGWRDDLTTNPKKREIFTKILNTRKEAGFPYIVDLTNANEARPQVYKDKGMFIETSNICSEIIEYCDVEKTFACCLSSVNLYWYDDWKNDPDFIFDMTILLDCVIEEYIEQASLIPGFEKAVKFCEEHRAVGLGTLGLHSYFQKNGMVFGELPSIMVNKSIFKQLSEQTLEASKWMAENWGEPLIMKGTGLRNSTRMAQAPTKTTTFIMGGLEYGLSEGIEPHKTNYGEKKVAKIQVEFKVPQLIPVLAKYDKDTKETWDSILAYNGSVQHLTFLTEDEKAVFRTFPEISQADVIKLAVDRQQYIDQGQSLNLMVHPDTPSRDIIKLHISAFSQGLKSLYYQYSINAAQQFNQSLMDGCASCEG